MSDMRNPRAITCLAVLVLGGALVSCSSPEGPATTVAGTLPPIELVRLPDGFQMNLYAYDLNQPRFMAWSPEGVLYVTEPTDGEVVALPDGNLDGVADEAIIWVSGLDRVHGLAFHAGYLYLAETGRVIRYPFAEGEVAGGEPEVIVADLPAGGQHWTRTIAFGPDGMLYVAAGSSCNFCEEEDARRAAVTRYTDTGEEETVFASGLRNSVGIAFHPTTGELWATDNGRDWLGDDLPPEEVNILREGQFYGWPYAYGERIPDPELGAVAPEMVAASVPPLISLQAHSAPLGLTFYSGDTFPAEYHGDLFIAQHGSWNRSSPVGYQVLNVDLEGEDRSVPGNPQPFAAGFLRPEGSWARPVDLSVGPDGALYITDDRNGTIYRISYGEEGSR
jgi:glucose/arabinose dehydrogenase